MVEVKPGDRISQTTATGPGAGPAPRPAAGLRHRWLTLVVLCVGQLMIVLDATVVNVALPVLQRDLHFTVSSVAWVVDGYLITFGGLLLVAGRLGDLLGRKRVFLIGVAAFTISSLLCGLTDSQLLLVAARFLQGAGAAVMASMVLGILVTLFTDPKERVAAMGVYAMVASAGGSIGLLVGGLLTQLVSWHWIFFINLPIGIATLVLAAVLVPSHRGLGLHHGVDLRGAFLVTAAPTLAVLAIVSASQSGWGSPESLGLGALTVVVAAAFVFTELRARTPLVRLGFFRSRTRTGANLARLLFPVGMFGNFFLGSLYLHQVLGYGPLVTGLAFLPSTLGMATFSLFLTKRVVARVGARASVMAGLLLVTVALLLMARVPEQASYLVNVLPAVTILGVGAGLFFMPSVALAMSQVRSDESGLASGLANVTFQFGAALGVALVAGVSSSTAQGLLRAGDGARVALAGGYQRGFLVAAVAVAVALLIAAAVLRPAPTSAVGLEVAAVAADRSGPTLEAPAESRLDPELPAPLAL